LFLRRLCRSRQAEKQLDKQKITGRQQVTFENQPTPQFFAIKHFVPRLAALQPSKEQAVRTAAPLPDNNGNPFFEKGLKRSKRYGWR
jgi:hypothetical protein